MALKSSTGLAKYLHATGSMTKSFKGGKIEVRTAPVPSVADDAVTGTLLYTITNAGATVKAKQKIRITPTVGTANAAVWNLTLNGITASFTDDGTPSAAEVCTGLYNAWRAASGLVAVTTPASTINASDIYQLFAFTDNTGTLDIEAATAGIPFSYAVSVSGAGAGTGSMATSVVTADAYGLEFEAAADITLGELEKLASQTWSATCVAGGTPAYWRLIEDGDTGASSTVYRRVQGTLSTAPGADGYITNAPVVTGQVVNVSSFKIRIPLT